MSDEQQGTLHTIPVAIGYAVLFVLGFSLGSWLISVVMLYGLFYPVVWVIMKLNAVVFPFCEAILPVGIGGLLGFLVSWAFTVGVVVVLPVFALFALGRIREWWSRRR